MSIRADRRYLETTPQPEAHQRLVQARRRRMKDMLQQASDFALILASKHYCEEQCASLKEYARKYGYHGKRAFVLARLGQAVEIEPLLAEGLLDNTIRVEHAEAVSDIFLNEALRGDDDWLDLARRCSLHALRSRVKERKETVKRSQEKLAPRTFFLSEKEIEDFTRAHELANSRAGDRLTEGEALGLMARHYRDSFDPYIRALLKEAKAQAKARKQGKAVPPGPKKGPRDAKPAKSSRYVPDDTERALWLRAGGRCELPGCYMTAGLQRSHLKAHSHGGGQTPRNLVLLCGRHHLMLETGSLEVCDWTDANRPVFRDEDGTVYTPEEGTGSPDRPP